MSFFAINKALSKTGEIASQKMSDKQLGQNVRL
jgi:hypothetical protein